MSDKTFYNVVEKLSDKHIVKLCPYLQNEPLADKRIIERISALKQLDFEWLEVATNASLLTEGKQILLLEALDGIRSEVRISFHGIDKYNYEKTMGLDFEAVLANIISFVKKAQSFPDCTVEIRCCGFSLGGGKPFIDKQEFTAFWHKHLCGSDGYRLDYFGHNDRAGNNDNNFGCNRPLNGAVCGRILDWVNIRYTGELILCCNDYQHEYILGDLNVSSLDDVLSGLKREVVIALASGRIKGSSPFICERCIG